ncbi:DUF1294 domain-containing protein [Desemzia sp. RIT804]|uniref:DUF1294 domain-containing protein n=1 Tax=Desemzia sp. RIT 804 TaxID=2810209 RepID=UPI001950CBB3|nr:DUF1294 domain-containing protein [Desemzia sp. RIT 804]MBM6613808.1 DUF1294 domain-containing protein [Desemzia sp. RIT 804]
MWLMLYFLLVNILLFIMMGVDKKKAVQRKWRIPEKNLLLIGLIGGGFGGLLGMKLYRHKTKEFKFKAVYVLGTCILIAGLATTNLI